jgi:hypothetical protein
MGKKQDPNQIYKWSAVTLTLLVAGYILFSFSRQALLDKQLAAFTRESPLPVVSPTPSQSPIISDNPQTKGWIQYSSPNNDFTFFYPPSTNKVTDEVGVFRLSYGGEFEVNRLGFEVTKLDNNNHFSYTITFPPQTTEELLNSLFAMPDGYHQTYKSRSGTSQSYLTKIRSLKINGLDAAYFTEWYDDGKHGPTDYANKYIIRNGDSYYMVAQSSVSSKDMLTQFQTTLGLIAKSFRLK